MDPYHMGPGKVIIEFPNGQIIVVDAEAITLNIEKPAPIKHGAPIDYSWRPENASIDLQGIGTIKHGKL